jgi:nucleotidyltransferase/DNA polymerase involved in DNA repair
MSASFSALKSRWGPDSQGLPSIECEVEGANPRSRHCQGGCRDVRINQLAGVGKINEEKLAKLGIKTVGELRSLDRANLEREFGRYGARLYEPARGIDENLVVPDRPTQSISVEDTFQEDVLLAETAPMIRHLAEKLWSALC